MQSISLSRVIDAPPDAVADALHDYDPFMRAAGFDEVHVDGDRIEISKTLGLLKISLTLRILDDPESSLAYEQLEGVFESMTTRYTLSEHSDGTAVSASTTFELDAPGGSILDATLIKRQRRKELAAQLAFLEESTT